MIWAVIVSFALCAYAIGVFLLVREVRRRIVSMGLSFRLGAVTAAALTWPIMLAIDLIERGK